MTKDGLLLYCDEEAADRARFSLQYYAEGDLARWCKFVREERKRQLEEEEVEQGVRPEMSLEDCIEWVAVGNFHLSSTRSYLIALPLLGAREELEARYCRVFAQVIQEQAQGPATGETDGGNGQERK